MNRTCRFVPHRNNRIRCNREASSDNAFCKRHNNTLQAQAYSHSEEQREDKSLDDKTAYQGYKKVQIVQNKFGNFEDKETGIVFNKKRVKQRGTKTIIMEKYTLFLPITLPCARKIIGII